MDAMDEIDDPAPPYTVSAWFGEETKEEPDLAIKIDGLREALVLWQETLASAVRDLATLRLAVVSVKRANGNIIASAEVGMPHGVETL